MVRAYRLERRPVGSAIGLHGVLVDAINDYVARHAKVSDAAVKSALMTTLKALEQKTNGDRRKT